MRKLFAVLIVLAISLVGFGVYRGWFAGTSPSPPAGSNLTTRTGKSMEGAGTVKDEAAELPGNDAGNSAEAADRPAEEFQANQASPDNGRPQGVDAER